MLRKWLATLNIPPPSDRCLKKREREAGMHIESVAKRSMTEVMHLERRLSLEAKTSPPKSPQSPASSGPQTDTRPEETPTSSRSSFCIGCKSHIPGVVLRVCMTCKSPYHHTCQVQDESGRLCNRCYGASRAGRIVPDISFMISNDANFHSVVGPGGHVSSCILPQGGVNVDGVPNSGVVTHGGAVPDESSVVQDIGFVPDDGTVYEDILPDVGVVPDNSFVQDDSAVQDGSDVQCGIDLLNLLRNELNGKCSDQCTATPDGQCDEVRAHGNGNSSNANPVEAVTMTSSSMCIVVSSTLEHRLTQADRNGVQAIPTTA